MNMITVDQETLMRMIAQAVEAEREEFQRWFDAVTAQHKQLILAEREACAKVCDEYSATGKIEEFDRGWLACAKNTADAIRARGNT